jgi:1-deoxy-D-xylulose-5-phosphate reductoisomerase
MAQRDVVVLGSTGSIGTQALDVCRANPDRFRVVALTAGGGNPRLFDAQVAEWSAAYDGLVSGLGEAASIEAAALECDVVLNGITGAVGLRPTLSALEAGNTLALANKESLIIGGPVVTGRAKPGQIVPVDSEHSALAQCLRGGTADEVRRLVLTASGGPFRGRSSAELEGVTVDEALAHPTWDMGPVVTINSATLVNKGLEVIEAHLLFGIPFDRIDVVVHPTSVVHSMVEFVDGSTLAQAGPPTMLIPIALGLAWPDRLPDTAPAVDWTRPETWEFFPLDDDAFPSVSLARQAGTTGGTAPAVYNAANEVAVEAFRNGRLAFSRIVPTIADVLAAHDVRSGVQLSVDDVLAADAWARHEASRLVGGRAGTPESRGSEKHR